MIEEKRRGRGRAQGTISMMKTISEIVRAIQPCPIRAIAYQLFTKKFIPSMATKETAKVSRWVTTMREEGELPWEWIVDTTRELEQQSSWDDPVAYSKTVQRAYPMFGVKSPSAGRGSCGSPLFSGVC